MECCGGEQMNEYLAAFDDLQTFIKACAGRHRTLQDKNNDEIIIDMELAKNIIDCYLVRMKNNLPYDA